MNALDRVVQEQARLERDMERLEAYALPRDPFEMRVTFGANRLQDAIVAGVESASLADASGDTLTDASGDTLTDASLSGVGPNTATLRAALTTSLEALPVLFYNPTTPSESDIVLATVTDGDTLTWDNGTTPLHFDHDTTHPIVPIYDNIAHGWWFGHDTANNATDNDTALNRCMARASAAGIGRVYAGLGTFDHERTEIAEGVTLTGQGIGRTILRLADDATIYGDGINRRGITNVSGISHCGVEDLEYDGNASAHRATWYTGSTFNINPETATGGSATTLTASVSGGATTITVASATGYVNGVQLTVTLNSGEKHSATVLSVAGSTLTLDTAFSGSGTVANSGNAVVPGIPFKFGHLKADGVIFRTAGSQTAPLRASIRNVYSHDCIRNCFAWNDPCKLNATNLWAKNSDADHLLYCSGTADGSNIANFHGAGFWRGGGVILNGQSLVNLVIEEIEDNPTPYSPTAVVTGRDKDAAVGQTRITGCRITEVNPSFLSSVFLWYGPMYITGLYVSQTGSSTSVLRLFDGNTVRDDDTDVALTEANFLSVQGYLVENVQADNFHVLETRNGVFESVYLYGGRINFSTGSVASANTPLFKVGAPTSGTVAIRDLYVDGLRMEGASKQLLYVAPGYDGKRMTFRGIGMMGGSAATELVDFDTGALVIEHSDFLADFTSIPATERALTTLVNVELNGVVYSSLKGGNLAEGRYHVNGFGAKGDDSTNDTAAINAAIAAAGAAGGGVVEFAAGRTYRVAPPDGNNSCVRVKWNNITIQGNGATLRATNNAATILQISTGDATAPGSAPTAIENVAVHDLRIRGTGVYAYSALGDGRGIHIVGGKNIQVRDCDVFDMSMIGIDVIHGYGFISIADNHCWNNGFTHLNFNGRAYQSVIANNICWTTHGSANSVGLQVTGGCSVIGNTIWDSEGPGIMWGEANFDGYGVISGNLVKNATTGIYAVYHGGAIISDNVVINATTGGIVIEGSTATGFTIASTHMGVRGNYILNCRPYSIEVRSSARSTQISNNTCRYIPSPLNPAAAGQPDYIAAELATVHIRAANEEAVVMGNILDGGGVVPYGAVFRPAHTPRRVGYNEVVNMAVNKYCWESPLSSAVIIANSSHYTADERALLRLSAATPQGDYAVGDEIRNTLPVPGGTPGWMCVYVDLTGTSVRVAASAGATTLEVGSTTGLYASDYIEFWLDNGIIHTTTIASITDADTLVLTAAIPAGRSALVGTTVYVWRAVKTTSAAAASVIAVSEVTNFIVGDVVGLVTSAPGGHWTTISAIDTALDTITLTTALPGGVTVAAGTPIFVYRWKAMASLV